MRQFLSALGQTHGPARKAYICNMVCYPGIAEKYGRIIAVTCVREFHDLGKFGVRNLRKKSQSPPPPANGVKKRSRETESRNGVEKQSRETESRNGVNDERRNPLLTGKNSRDTNPNVRNGKTKLHVRNRAAPRGETSGARGAEQVLWGWVQPPISVVALKSNPLSIPCEPRERGHLVSGRNEIVFLLCTSPWKE